MNISINYALERFSIYFQILEWLLYLNGLTNINLRLLNGFFAFEWFSLSNVTNLLVLYWESKGADSKSATYTNTHSIPIRTVRVCACLLKKGRNNNRSI